MGKVISIHSSRGGTGKSVIAVNLAMILLKSGYNVSLLDLDFRSPSLFNIFREIKKPVGYWLNDFFNNRCKIDQVLIDISEGCNAEKKILVGLANPSIYAIGDMMCKSQRWEASALNKLYSLKRLLLNDMKIDYLIYDTSPGIQYSSINAITSSDLPIVVATADPLDIECTRKMLSEFYDIFKEKTVLLMNKVFPEVAPTHGEKELVDQLIETLSHPIIGIIPCYCDVLRAKRDYLLSLKNPTHPFIRKLEQIAEELVKY